MNQISRSQGSPWRRLMNWFHREDAETKSWGGDAVSSSPAMPNSEVPVPPREEPSHPHIVDLPIAFPNNADPLIVLPTLLPHDEISVNQSDGDAASSSLGMPDSKVAEPPPGEPSDTQIMDVSTIGHDNAGPQAMKLKLPPHEEVSASGRLGLLETLLNHLGPFQRELIARRHGIGGYTVHSIVMVAHALGMTPADVRRSEHTILTGLLRSAKVREQLEPVTVVVHTALREISGVVRAEELMERLSFCDALGDTTNVSALAFLLAIVPGIEELRPGYWTLANRQAPTGKEITLSSGPRSTNASESPSNIQRPTSTESLDAGKSPNTAESLDSLLDGLFGD